MRSRLTVVVGAVAIVLHGALPSHAAPFTYVNDRFGTTAVFPDDVFSQPQPPPENGDGQRWLSTDGASLAIYGGYNVLDETPEGLIEAAKVAGRTVTYSKAGRDWAVISGTDGDDIFYERHEFGDETIHSIVVAYPAALKGKYDAIVGKIAASLSGP